ncbi:MAG: TetR family transcriptional regulator [Nonomuraea sp.]|nr:TetR family transcriptional regulator [Nonomuraea sp.]
MEAETIVAEALDLLKEEGLAGVTFRRLTTRLGVKAPAIYWRFANKQELLEAMAESILRERFADLAPLPDEDPWRPWLAGLLGRLRAALLAYPDGARVVTGARPMSTPTLAGLAEHALSTLERRGLDLSEAATIVFTGFHYTFGHVIEEQDSSDATEMDEDTAARFADRFPTIARALSLGIRTGATSEDVYQAGLTRILA